MDFDQSSSGKIFKSITGYKAFIPNQLPPQIEWTNELMNTLSRADFVLGKLAREGIKMSNPHLLIRPFITREAVLSSKIEGTQATIDELLALNAGAAVQRHPDEIQKVQNYIQALNFGIAKLETFPLSLRLIKEIHECLMQGVRGSHATPGEFRRSQNWIGIAGCTLNNAKYVPPPMEFLMECLGEFEKFLHNRQLPPLIHAALSHYQFEAIHPFLDGNGRIGRLLIILLLIEQKILPCPILYISAFFEATRDEYYRLLYNVSAQGKWNEWLIYFLNGIALQSEDVLSRIERIYGLLDQWKIRVKSSTSSIPLLIVEQLGINPYLTTKKMAEILKIAYSTAQRNIQKIEKAKIIKQVGETKRDKVYCAVEVLSILDEPAKIKMDIYSHQLKNRNF